MQGKGTRGSVGTTLNESLPNIKGAYYFGSNAGVMGSDSTFSGVIKRGTQRTGTLTPIQGYAAYDLDFDASRSSSSYQDNAPVQQDALCMNYIIKY